MNLSNQINIKGIYHVNCCLKIKNLNNKMIYSLICLLTGIYIGQEYRAIIPNIKVLGISIIEFIKEKYKEEDFQIQDDNNKMIEYFFKMFN